MASKTAKMESLEPRQLLTVGAPDPTFGVNGVATFRHIGALNQLLAEPDGKLLGIGNDLLVQFNSDGSIDSSFGSGGEITSVFTPVDAAFDSQGNIVAAGTSGNDILVTRFNSEGQLDDSFGHNGVVVLDPPSGDDYTAGDVMVEGNNLVVVAGQESDGQSTELVLTRLNGDGSLNLIFAGTGIVDADSNAYPPMKLTLSDIGDIVVSSIYVAPDSQATAGDTIVLTTVGPGGAIYPSVAEEAQQFGATTRALIPTSIGDAVLAVDTSDGGKVAVVASDDGNLDPTFGANGVLQLGTGPFAFTQEPDGNYLYVNDQGVGSDYNAQGAKGGVTLSEYSENGTPVESFGPLDQIYSNLGGYQISFGSGAAVTSNGNVVLFGTVRGHLALVKLQIADSGATNPTANVTQFVGPHAGGKYGYVTVRFTQGANALTTSDLAAHGLLMTYNGTTLQGTLVSANSGGDGQPITATYAVKLNISRASNGVYQFTIAPDAIVDSSGAGNVGEALAAYDLYVPPRNRGNIVLTSTSLLTSDLPTTFYS